MGSANRKVAVDERVKEKGTVEEACPFFWEEGDLEWSDNRGVEQENRSDPHADCRRRSGKELPRWRSQSTQI